MSCNNFNTNADFVWNDIFRDTSAFYYISRKMDFLDPVPLEM